MQRITAFVVAALICSANVAANAERELLSAGGGNSGGASTTAMFGDMGSMFGMLMAPSTSRKLLQGISAGVNGASYIHQSHSAASPNGSNMSGRRLQSSGGGNGGGASTTSTAGSMADMGGMTMAPSSGRKLLQGISGGVNGASYVHQNNEKAASPSSSGRKLLQAGVGFTSGDPMLRTATAEGTASGPNAAAPATGRRLQSSGGGNGGGASTTSTSTAASGDTAAFDGTSGMSAMSPRSGRHLMQVTVNGASYVHQSGSSSSHATAPAASSMGGRRLASSGGGGEAGTTGAAYSTTAGRAAAPSGGRSLLQAGSSVGQYVNGASSQVQPSSQGKTGVAIAPATALAPSPTGSATQGGSTLSKMGTSLAPAPLTGRRLAQTNMGLGAGDVGAAAISSTGNNGVSGSGASGSGSSSSDMGRTQATNGAAIAPTPAPAGRRLQQTPPGLGAGDKGSATISSQGTNGVSGSGASGSGASNGQGRSQATNGAAIAPTPASAVMSGRRLQQTPPGLRAGDTGSATISSQGTNGMSGTGASGSGASSNQGRSQATNGAAIAPAPVSGRRLQQTPPGLGAGDTGSATISSQGNNGVSGTGASGSGGPSTNQSQATNGAAIAPAPV